MMIKKTVHEEAVNSDKKKTISKNKIKQNSTSSLINVKHNLNKLQLNYIENKLTLKYAQA